MGSILRMLGERQRN